MRIFFVLLAVTLSSQVVTADSYVRGYTRGDGRYVEPHYRSGADKSYNNNWSVQPNTNPHTGDRGNSRPTWDDRPPSSSGSNSFDLGGARSRR